MYLSPERNSDAKIVILFIPHAGSCGETYMHWFKYFPENIDCRYFQLPARGAKTEDVLPESIQEIADLAIPELKDLSDKKIVLFGHSMGGLIAFELASKIEEHCDKPVHALFVSGCRAPDESLGRKLTCLNDEQLISELADMGGTEKLLLEQPELLSPFLSILRKDVCVCEKYLCTKIKNLLTPIYILWGTDDYLITQDMIEGWKKFSREGNISFHPFNGDHFYHFKMSKEIIKLMNEVIINT